MKTAVTEIFEKYGHLLPDVEDKYKETEKQQIIDAVTHGNRMEFYDASETAGEQYYTSTFETNKETLK